VGWFLAFVAQAVATAQHNRGAVGTLWFAIFLQLFLILGVLHTLATDSIAMHRFQISVFGAIAIVFAVDGVNNTIFTGFASLDAVAAGWLILAVVDILWTLYFTSEEDSLMLHIFNSMGTGGLTPPGRRRRRTQSVHNMSGNGYTTGYAAPGSLGPVGYDAKANSFAGGPVGSGASFKQGSVEARSLNAGSVNQVTTPSRGPVPLGAGDNQLGMSSPLMGSGAAGVGAGGGPPLPGVQSSPTGGAGGMVPPESGSMGSAGAPGENSYLYRAKAMYAYTANADDPNEISFDKGEILEITDKQGKWWQARRADGSMGTKIVLCWHMYCLV
ncbi:hypothetical protein PHLCEN_2v2753, partial [Hermanssonia centrifuga]